jgi:hypothetical protein
MKFGVVLFCLILAIFSQSIAAQSPPSEEPEANPGRPTVSTPATLTPVGYLQFETGFLGATQSPGFSSRYSMNEILKLSVTPRLEFIAGGEPVARFTSAGATATHVGGAGLGAQALLLHGEGGLPALAVSYIHSIYNGDVADLDLGSPVNAALVLTSFEVKGFHARCECLFQRSSAGTGRPISIWAIAQRFSSTQVRFFSLGEIWHFPQPFLQSEAVGNLWAISYQPRKYVVLDVGFNHGLTAPPRSGKCFAASPTCSRTASGAPVQRTIPDSLSRFRSSLV